MSCWFGRLARGLLVGCLVLAGCSSDRREAEVVVESEGTTRVVGGLVSDGRSVWSLVEGRGDRISAVEVVKVDAETGAVKWRKPVGFGTVDPLLLHDGVLWAQVNSTTSAEEPDHRLVRIDAETGDVTGELSTEGYGVAVVNGLLWTFERTRYVEVVDTTSLQVVDTINRFDVEDPFGKPMGLLAYGIEFDNVVWLTDQARTFGFDPDTREMISFAAFPDGEFFGHLEVHDGVLWARETLKPSSSTTKDRALKIDTEESTVEVSDLFESPVGSVEHGGFVFDVVGEDKVVQIDAESGDAVATFEGLDPFNFVVTDGYVWTHDGEQVLRYETATG